MCWTFIIQYGTRVFTQTGMEEQAAEVLSQRYNIVGDGNLLRKPLHLYVPDEILFAGGLVDDIRHRRLRTDRRRNRISEH